MADLKTCPPLTRASVEAAHALIKPHIHETPVLTNTTLTTLASTPQDPSSPFFSPSSPSSPINNTNNDNDSPKTPASPRIRLFFKCENLQRGGAFKARGAFHAVGRLLLSGTDADATFDPARGVATHSSGNHAQALALAAREHKIPCHVVMPSISAAPKVAATRGYGARVVFSGSTAAEREVVAARVVRETGARLVPPYDHPDVMLGQGTLALEMMAQVAELKKRTGEGEDTAERPVLDAIIAPCGGGGMLSGVALACEGTGVRVFGAEPTFEGADDAGRGYRAGKRVEAVSTRTVADGLRTPLGVFPWGVIYERRLVAGFYAVGEDEIRAAVRLVWERCKLVVEPSAVVGLAVALYNEDFRAMVEREAGPAGWDLGVVFSGGNVDLDALSNLFGKKEEEAEKK